MLQYFAFLLWGLTMFDTYWVPSGSMKPTLLPGDYLLVRPQHRGFDRGDVVVFRHPATDVPFLKRVVGLPGDVVQMVDGAVVLNGAPVARSETGVFPELYAAQGPARFLPRCAGGHPVIGGPCDKPIWRETLPGGRTFDTLDIDMGTLDNTPEVTVPEGHYFVLGDNRDNSVDSRVATRAGGVGLVPEDRLLGRVVLVAFSARGAHLWNPGGWREDRIMKGIE